MKMIKIHPIVTNNELQNIFYILEYGEKKALVIDPCDSKMTQDFLRKNNLDLQRILITHEHYDHYDGVDGLACSEVYIGKICSENIPIKVSYIFEDGEIVFEYESSKLKAIFTPGHAEGHMMFEYSESGRVISVFSGDVLFSGGVGHTRSGSNEDLHNSVRKFEKYSDEVIIYSGHDYLENNFAFIKEYFPERSMEIDEILWQKCNGEVYFTNLLQERSINPFIGVSLEEFVKIRELRNTW